MATGFTMVKSTGEIVERVYPDGVLETKKHAQWCIDQIKERIFGNSWNSGCISSSEWASRREQAENRRDNKKYLINGLLLSIVQHAIRVGINVSTAYYRIKRGWPVEDALKKENLHGTKKYARLKCKNKPV